MTESLLLAAVFVLSLLGTGLVRRYAIARSVLDLPNERSSHRLPTPRGGGVAIVATFLAGLVVLWAGGTVSSSVGVAVLGAGTGIAIVGFLDDHESIRAGRRLLSHFLVAAWALYWLGGLPPLMFFGWQVDLGLPGDVLAAVGLVWLLNLYNFMDGIDGVAGIEAVTVCLGAIGLVALGPLGGNWLLPSLLGASVCGFLVWNFPPAKIFMGDAGSGFLGLMLGILAIQATTVSPRWFWSWAILLGVFIVDATVTLLRRLHRGERVHLAHRSHAYQHAALKAGSHRTVTLAIGAINVFWLLPIALAVGVGRIDGVSGTVLAYAPLVWLARRFEAGVGST